MRARGIPRAAMLLAIAALLLLPRPRSRAQESTAPPQYKAETTLVVVDAIVTDKKGRVVPGLTANDFKVYENGAEQKIVDFTPPSLTSTPLPSPGARPAASPRASSAALPQFITVVLDLSDNRPINIKRSCDAVLEHLRRTAEEKRAQVAIYYIDHGLHLALPFTSDYEQAGKTLVGLEQRASRGTFTGTDRRAIQQQIDELYLKAHPESVAVSVPGDTGPSPGSRSGPAEPFAQAYMREINTLRGYLAIENTYQVREVLIALRSIALAYRDLPGRKNVILFSEGFPYSSDNRKQLDAVIATADVANVSFYVIDPSGLETGVAIDTRSTSALNSQMNEIAQQGIGDTQGGQSKFDRMRALGDRSLTEQLDQLATSTGGFLVKNTNDLRPAFARILSETGSYYVLTYRPTNPAADGTFRPIRLEVAGEGLELRYRKGYWALPRGSGVMMSPAAAQLIASVANGTLRPSLKHPAIASSALAADGTYVIVLSVAVPGRQAVGSQGEKSDPLTVIAVARDAGGRILSAYEKEWRLAAEAAERPGNIIFQGELPYVDGAKTLEVLVRQPDGAYGMTTAPVEPPTGGTPQLSAVILASEIERTECADRSEALCIADVRLHLPASHTLAVGGKLIAVVGASGLTVEPQSRKPRVGAVFSVKQAGRLLGSIPEKNVQAVPGVEPGTVWFVAQLSLKSLPAGDYTLEINAKDFGRDASISNVTSFEIR